MSRHIAHLLEGGKKASAENRHHRADGGRTNKHAFEVAGARNTSFAKAQGPSSGKPKLAGRATSPETDMDGEPMPRSPGKGQAPRTLKQGGTTGASLSGSKKFVRAQSISAGGPKYSAAAGERESDMDGEPMPRNASKKRATYKPSTRLGPDQATGVSTINKYARGGAAFNHKTWTKDVGDTGRHDEVPDDMPKTSIPGENHYKRGGNIHAELAKHHAEMAKHHKKLCGGGMKHGGRTHRDMGGAMPMQGAPQGTPQGYPPRPMLTPQGGPAQSPYKRGGQPKDAMPYKRGGHEEGGKHGLMLVIGVGDRKKKAVGGSLEKPMYLDNRKADAKGTGIAKRGRTFTDA